MFAVIPRSGDDVCCMQGDAACRFVQQIGKRRRGAFSVLKFNA